MQDKKRKSIKVCVFVPTDIVLILSLKMLVSMLDIVYVGTLIINVNSEAN